MFYNYHFIYLFMPFNPLQDFCSVFGACVQQDSDYPYLKSKRISLSWAPLPKIQEQTHLLLIIMITVELARKKFSKENNIFKRKKLISQACGWSNKRYHMHTHTHKSLSLKKENVVIVVNSFLQFCAEVGKIPTFFLMETQNSVGQNPFCQKKYFSCKMLQWQSPSCSDDLDGITLHANLTKNWKPWAFLRDSDFAGVFPFEEM